MNAFGFYEIGKNQQGYLFLNFLGFDECFGFYLPQHLLKAQIQ